MEQTVLLEHPLQPLAHELNLETGLAAAAAVLLELEERGFVAVEEEAEAQVRMCLPEVQEEQVLWL